MFVLVAKVVAFPFAITTGFVVAQIFASMTPRNIWSLLGLRIFRLVFPPWKFFDSAKEEPQLLFRMQDTTGLWSNWQPLIRPPDRRFRNIWINGEHNDCLARNNIVRRFCDELGERDKNAIEGDFDVEAMTSYRLMQRFVELEVARSSKVNADPNDTVMPRFQFRVVIHVFAKDENTIEDLVISRVYAKPNTLGNNSGNSPCFDRHIIVALLSFLMPWCILVTCLRGGAS